jgi:putative membrane protein
MMFFPFFGGWMIIVWVVIIGLIVWAVIALTRHTASGSGGGGGGGKSAMDIARERYARGEITKEQFDQIKKDLS